MATTDTGIRTPDSVDKYKLVQDLAVMADTVDAALKNSWLDTGSVRFATTAARDTWTTANMSKLTAGVEATVGYDRYIWDGTAWTLGTTGLVLLRKQSFSNAGIAAVENVFSNRFAHYKLEVAIRALSSAGSAGFQYMNGVTAASGGTDYFAQSRSSSGGSTSTVGANGNNVTLTKSGGVLILHASVDLYDVSLPVRTVALVRSHGVGGVSAAENSDITCHHNVSTGYNGFRLITSGGGVTLSGEVSVYGVK